MGLLVKVGVTVVGEIEGALVEVGIAVLGDTVGRKEGNMVGTVVVGYIVGL